MNEPHDLQAEPAAVGGEAAIIRARPAVLRATIQIKRAATGKVEEYELVGHVAQDDNAPE